MLHLNLAVKTITLIGEDDGTFRYLSRRLKSMQIERVTRFDEFSLAENPTDLAILRLDSDFPPPLMRVAQELKAAVVPFIVLSSVETMKAAVQAMRLGAFDYFLASEDRDELIDAVQRRLESRRLHRTETADLDLDVQDVMVGSSQKIQEVFKLIGKIAQSNVSVLLRGESGTGKELVARQLHVNSPRREAPFVVIDCAAIPRDLVENELFGHEVGAYSGAGSRHLGKFDLADNGTMLLDEITELDVDLQSKILRVMQQGTFDRVGGTQSISVDVRTIAASHSKLEELVRDGRFRQDLYHRLNVITLYLPPLRDRREDIPVLVRHFVRKHGRALGLPSREVAADLMARLERYHWPGNVRELENIIKRALIMERGPVLTPHFLEEYPVPGEGPIDEEDVMFQRLIGDRFLSEELNWKRSDVHRQMVSKVEYLLLRLVLSRTRGNQVTASRLLGISRNTLRVRMAELSLDSAQFRT